MTVLSWNTPPGQPERVTLAEIDHLLALLTSKPGQNGGVPGLHTVEIGECGVLGLRSNNCPDTPWVPTDTGFNDANQIITQGTQQGTGTTVTQGTGRRWSLIDRYRLLQINTIPETSSSIMITRE